MSPANGLDSSDWFLARLDQLSSWGARFRSLTNWALRTRWTRWLLERFTGIAQGRKLPQLAPRSFLREAERRGLGKPVRGGGEKVLYFVDSYANWYDWELAEALLAILRRHAISVYVPPSQQPSGMAQISLGDIEGARPLIRRNVSLLADAVRQGYKIICSEPSAASCLTHEYPRILDDDDSRLVAENTFDACVYLWKRHQVGRLELDLRPVNLTLGYHEPCHLRSLDADGPGARLLQLIPGLELKRIERGCSGMAGAFGLAKKNYRASLRIGWGLISGLRNSALDLGTTECSACKMQMEQGVEKATVHPLKMLALSYGLLPGGERLLVARGKEFVIT
jgi:Fe-S oxidoreductase